MLVYENTKIIYDYTFLDGKEHVRIKVAPHVPIPDRGEEFFICFDIDTAIVLGKDENFYRTKFSKQTKDGVFIYAIAIKESEVTQDASTQNAVNVTANEPELFNFSSKIGTAPDPFALAFQKLYGRQVCETSCLKSLRNYAAKKKSLQNFVAKRYRTTSDAARLKFVIFHG